MASRITYIKYKELSEYIIMNNVTRVMLDSALWYQFERTETNKCHMFKN